MTDSAVEVMEDLDAFRLRARAWLADNMPRLSGDNPFPQLPVDDDGIRGRELQRKLFDGGFTGLVFPKEYGGQGLTRAHQRAFNQESAPYEMPITFNVPTLTIIAPTLLDYATEEQKKRHLPAILRGDELWVQFLSEPSGGSDLAGLLTRATRDGDVWVLNGSKIWSSGAYRSDYALCLARTDWEAPKHRGLTMFIVKIHQPGITVQQIKMVNGVNEFCQEFFDDVPIPAENVVGQVNDGWTVASRLLFHERDAVGGGSPYFSGFNRRRGPQRDLIELAVDTGQRADPRVRRLVAEAHANDMVQQQLIERVTTGLRTGYFPGPAGALLRLYAGLNGVRRSDIGFEIAGTNAIAWSGDRSVLGQYGQQFVMRQASCLGGGSTEMQRNIISERLLGMPREYAADRDTPFNQVRQNRLPLNP
jgi:alkylation response protein AidB-like acyl-CoA dehydrogenase